MQALLSYLGKAPPYGIIPAIRIRQQQIGFFKSRSQTLIFYLRSLNAAYSFALP